MSSSHHPWAKEFSDLIPADLAVLREVAEGWYIEYKRQPPSVRAIAKSISSFANQYGGYLIIGIEEAADQSRTAGAFPGVPRDEIPLVETWLREASRTQVNPHVFYSHLVLHGPCNEIGLAEGRSIVVVHIPRGNDSPYVHGDARIYRRVADSSEPKAESERSSLDMLWRRGEKARKQLRRLTKLRRPLSKSEEEIPRVEFLLTCDPMEHTPPISRPSFEDFARLMRSRLFPFETSFPSADGYVARMAMGNSQLSRVPTWEYSRMGHSFVAVPLNYQRNPSPDWLRGYNSADEFIAIVTKAGLQQARIVDLSQLYMIVAAIVARHRQLMKLAHVEQTCWCKVRVRNVWRCVPFMDAQPVLDQFATYGVPIVQQKGALKPRGDGLLGMIQLPFYSVDEEKLGAEVYTDAWVLTALVVDVFGLARDTIAACGKELAAMATRAMAANSLRSRSELVGA